MEQIKLDIVPVGVAPVAHASQFDNSRQIRFNLFNQGTPYTLTGAETVTMVVNGEEENITNTSDNYVIWDVAEEDCEEVGVISCEIRIVLGSMLIGSKNFFLEVEMDPYDGKNIRIVTVGPADICAFETNLPEPLQAVVVDVVASQQSGTPTPSSPLAITGYSSANITRCGVNLFDKSTVTSGRLINGAGNEVSYSGWNVSDYIPVPEGASLYLNGLTTHPNTLQDNFELFDASKTKIGYANVRTNEYPWTIPTGTKYVKFSLNDSDLNTAQFSPTNNAPYTPYNGQTYAISFGQTVYGGVLDVTRGKLTVTHTIFDLGSISYTYVSGNHSRMVGSHSGGKLIPNGEIFNGKCEAYTPDSLTNIYSHASDKTIGYSGTDFWIYDTDYTDADAFKTAMDGVHVTYELATPFDIDLTPEVISAIVGENNVFAGCGQTTVKYLKAGE